MENKNDTANAKKVKSSKPKKPNFFVRMWRKIKEVFSELKKVTWPSFATVMKQLGCVLVLVVLVLVIIMGIDFGLQKLLGLVQGTAAIIGEVL